VRTRALILLLALALLAALPQVGQGAEFTLRPDGWYAPAKSPNETLNFGVDWTDWLAGDTILTSTWTVGTGLTVGAKTIDPAGQKATLWLSGGTLGQVYILNNKITTQGGRIKEQTWKLEIKAR